MAQNEQSKTPSAWPEILFSASMFVIGVIGVHQSLASSVDEVGINARTMPSIMAGLVAAFGLWQLISLVPAGLGQPFSLGAGGKLTTRIIIPLCAEMVAYVLLISLFGFATATALTMVLVLWTFGSRKIMPNIVIACVTAGVMQLIFISALGMYMPEGSLINLF